MQSVWPCFCLASRKSHGHRRQRALVERLLLERISLRGTCRVVGERTGTGSGSGWRWTPRLAKSSPFTSATAGARAPEHYGSRFLPCTKSRPHSTRINRRCTKESSLEPNTAPSLSWPVRRIMWSVLTAPYDNGSPAWYGPRFRSRRSLPIMSVPSSILSVIITSPDVQHYLDSTTRKLPLSAPVRAMRGPG